ncbi:peptidylprolyl isomerase [Leptotrichia sp. OH3620_COT-345]|uniref:peptidylprolyl isomerase n=1 Tax=Leptotrichia sp. OH3620_COT-345 TaxID=2491048 RepID=UPI000F6486F0|nr:peptidylprolyl isomerase [Leptotrichia sp. OH3620_COT-345]RRD38468.1 peptidylprolyl isomerase [Leptotrichia sp. OH3620_COT-345]
MSVRKHKSTIKVISIILILAFGVSMIYAGWNFLKQNVFVGTKKVIAEVNGEKIYRDDFERNYADFESRLNSLVGQKKQQLAQVGIDPNGFKTLPEELMREYVLKSMIDQKLLLSSAKDLKVKVSSADVENKVKSDQNQYGGKENFINFLTANGYNLTSYKEFVKNGMILQKVYEKIQNSLKINDDELKKVYERYKYFNFQDQTFEQAKPQLIETLNNENAEMLISSHLAKAWQNAKITVKSDKERNVDYKKMYDNIIKTIVEKDGYKFDGASLNEKIIGEFVRSEKGYSDVLVEQAKKSLEADLDKLITTAKKAKEVGIKASSEFSGIQELNDYAKKYYDYLIDTYKPSEEAMMEKFNSGRDNYNVQNTIAGQVVGDYFQPSQADFEVIKVKAQEILKTLTIENFKEKAKELSQDPGSKDNGGQLGEVDLTQLVPEFAEAVKKSEKGKIVGPVKTQFGYHIIYVEDKNSSNENSAKVSHILITPTISEATKQELIKRMKTLKDELVAKKVTWQQVNTQDKYKFEVKEQFKKLLKSQAIPGVGKYDSELSNKLFASNPGDILEHQTEYGYFLLSKISEVPFKEVSFEDVKERIRLELAFEYVNEEVEK